MTLRERRNNDNGDDDGRGGRGQYVVGWMVEGRKEVPQVDDKSYFVRMRLKRPSPGRTKYRWRRAGCT